MTLEELFAMGATSVGGAIDLRGRNIGRLTANGLVISRDGQEFLDDLARPVIDADPAPKVSKSVAKRKAAQAPAPADDDVSLSDTLDQLL